MPQVIMRPRCRTLRERARELRERRFATDLVRPKCHGPVETADDRRLSRIVAPSDACTCSVSMSSATCSSTARQFGAAREQLPASDCAALRMLASKPAEYRQLRRLHEIRLVLRPGDDERMGLIHPSRSSIQLMVYKPNSAG